MNANQTQLNEAVTLGSKIKNKRLELGLSQKELVAGSYSEAYLSKVERDQMPPSDGFLTHLASRLDLTLSDLLEEAIKVHPKVKKAALEAQELKMMDAHIAIQTNQPEKARYFLKKVELEELTPDLLARYYAIFGEAEMGLENYEAALLNLERALQLFKATPRVAVLEVERVRSSLGLAYYRQNKHFLALEHHQLCLKAINEGQIYDSRFKMKVYYNLANEYHAIGNHPQALQFYREAVKLAEEGEDSTDLAGVYWGIGLVYRALENLAMAQLYLDKSATLYETIPDLKLASTVRGILGLTMAERHEFEQAEVALQAALEIATRLQNDNALYSAYTNLAYFYYTKGNLSAAEQNAEAGVLKARTLNNGLLLGQALGQLADIKIARDFTEEGLALFEEALSVLAQTDSAEYLKQVCFRYAAALEKKGNLATAIQMYRKAYTYQSPC